MTVIDLAVEVLEARLTEIGHERASIERALLILREGADARGKPRDPEPATSPDAFQPRGLPRERAALPSYTREPTPELDKPLSPDRTAELEEIARNLAEERFKCDWCDHCFTSGRALGGHRARCPEKPDAKTYTCPEPGCARTFKAMSGLGSHRRSHDLDGPIFRPRPPSIVDRLLEGEDDEPDDEQKDPQVGSSGAGRSESNGGTENLEKGARDTHDREARDNATPPSRNPASTEPSDPYDWANIPGAHQLPGGGTIRADGEAWECTCGVQRDTLGRMRIHINGALTPAAHQLIIPPPPAEPVRNLNPDTAHVAGQVILERAETTEHQCAQCRPPQRFPTADSLVRHVERAHRAPTKTAARVDPGIRIPPRPHPVAPIPPARAAAVIGTNPWRCVECSPPREFGGRSALDEHTDHFHPDAQEAS